MPTLSDLAFFLRRGGLLRAWYVAESKSFVAEYHGPDGTRTLAVAPVSLEDAFAALIERMESTALSDTDRPEPSAAALLAGTAPIGPCATCGATATTTGGGKAMCRGCHLDWQEYAT
jgi:hypothetical protein